MGAFAGLNTIPENTDAFSSQLFSGSCSKSMPFSVQVDGRLMNGDASAPQFTVMGSNVSGLASDMVNMVDETGRSGAFPISQPFVKDYCPYKYIGIQYSHGTNAGTGTLVVTFN